MCRASRPTHAGSFDLSYLRCIPDILVMTPSNEAECRQMLSTGFLHNGPAAVRYPRGSGPGVLPEDNDLTTLPIGKAEVIRSGSRAALLCFGTVVTAATPVAEKWDLSLVNMRFVKPLDTDTIDTIATTHNVLICIEDNVVAGGAGSAVLEYLANRSGKASSVSVKLLGLPDRHQSHGSREELLAEAGMDTDGIDRQVGEILQPE